MHTDVPFHIGAELAADYIQSHPECQTLDPAFDAWCDKILSVRSAAAKAMEQL